MRFHSKAPQNGEKKWAEIPGKWSEIGGKWAEIPVLRFLCLGGELQIKIEGSTGHSILPDLL